MYKEDTIAAVATPAGEGGVGIVRVSGPDAERIASALFVRAEGKNGRLKSHMLHYGAIREPKSEKILDQVLLTIMRKPRSYTGEDVVEVHCHGGVFVVRRILGLILAQGARHAEPGEFTKRAFLNGRLDLAQAEAVVDLINARTLTSHRAALQHLEGALSRHLHALREQLLQVSVYLEAGIDFPEEDLDLVPIAELIERLATTGTQLTRLLETFK